MRRHAPDLTNEDRRRGPLFTYRAADVAVVVLDRPETYNAIGTPTLTHLKHVVGDCGVDAAAIVLASEGRHFCVGADLVEVTSALTDRARISTFLELFHDVADTIASSPVPVIAAVQGYALAGGLELALSCDLIVAADNAEFGDQHINVDLIPGGGGSQRLPRAIGTRRALALQMVGDRIGAYQALAWGLVHSVHSEETLREQAIQLAAKIASRNPAAIRRIRELNRVASTLSLEEGLAIERATVVEHLSGLESSESLRSFAYKSKSGAVRSQPSVPGGEI